MMEYVLVALLTTGPGTYDVEVVQEFKTMSDCKKTLEVKVWTIKNILSLVCAKKDWD
jgi:hypothetical protein